MPLPALAIALTLVAGPLAAQSTDCGRERGRFADSEDYDTTDGKLFAGSGLRPSF